MRKILYMVLLLAIVPLVGAVSLSVETVPAVLKPGTEGTMILYITTTAPITSLKIEVPEAHFIDLEREGGEIDLGDAQGGTVSTTLWFRVPSDINPGTYFLDFVIRHTDASTQESYEEHFTVPLAITDGEGLSLDFPKKIYGGVERGMDITVKNSGGPIYSATLIVPDAVGRSDIYLGDIGTGGIIKKSVTILPTCNGGIYRTVLTLTGYRGSKFFERNFSISVPCIPPVNDIGVEFNVPERTVGGEQVSKLKVINNSDLPTGPISIVVTGNNVRLGGKTSFYINGLGPRNAVSYPVRWELDKSDEPGVITITLTTEQGTRTYTYSILPYGSPELKVYLTEEPVWDGDKVKATVAVANVGTDTAENVFVTVEGKGIESGNSILGDLAPGDYDTVTFYLREVNVGDVKVKVSYYSGGMKFDREFDLEINPPPRKGNYIAVVVVIAAIIAVVLLWRRRK